MSYLYRILQSVGRTIGPESQVGRLVHPIGERLLSWTTGRRGLEWEINGIPCLIDPLVRRQLARIYDPEVASYLRGKVLPGQVCLDIGANVGAWVIQLASAVGPTGRVIAFEPNPGARKVLSEHVRLNQLEKIVQIVPAAVGATSGEVTFMAAGADGMSRIGKPNPLLGGKATPIPVSVVTIDGWCQENGVKPNWLFIDIEGFEGDALLGATNVIHSEGPQLGMIVEMHPEIWAATGTSKEEVAARISALGRHPVPLTGQPDPLGEYGHVSLEPIS